MKAEGPLIKPVERKCMYNDGAITHNQYIQKPRIKAANPQTHQINIVKLITSNDAAPMLR